jgi:glycerol-3-phosphate dehydrogenase
MRSASVDVFVIGGGVNGLAVAREALLRGWSTVLVEAEDVAAGTSGASSRLIHGGIRYLENLEFGLVRESLKERERLLRAAPHLVRPFPLLIPFYERNKRRSAVLRLGMVLYDGLSRGKSLPSHSQLSSARVRADYPGLDQDGLTGGVLYYDAQVANAERLCVEQMLDIRGLGGSVRTHVRVTGVEACGDQLLRVRTLDTSAGHAEEYLARFVVNAAGPWVDLVLKLAGPGAPRLIGGAKGTHLTVAAFPGAPRSGVHFEAVTDGRAILVLPLPGGTYLLGATDIFVDGDPGEMIASDGEIDYLLGEVNRLVPEAALTRADILHSVSGVRPLPFSPAARSAADVSRNHALVAHPHLPGLYSVTGGKLTTHRALGEYVLDRLEDGPSSRRRVTARSRRRRSRGTRDLKLPGARCADWDEFERGFLQTSELPGEVARRLLDIYGVRALGVLDIARSDERGMRRLPGGSAAIAAEVPFVIREEQASTLVDILARRLLLAWNDDAGLSSVDAVAQFAAPVLGWNEAQRDHEIQSYRRWIRRRRPLAYEIPGPAREADVHAETWRN